MALTLTSPRNEVVGQRRHHSATVAFDSSYASGGEALTPAMFGLTVIDEVRVNPAGGYAFEYDYTNQTLKVRPTVTELTETVTRAASTDNTDTTGFKDFAGTIPLGSIILGWRTNTTTGWTGDTSAVMQIGVAGDLDRFTADVTSSVFAAGVDGSNALAADASDGIAAAVTPRVTVTSAADFTNVAAGTTVVSIIYVAPSLPAADLSGLTGIRVVAIGY
jgi:hypothetical protein